MDQDLQIQKIINKVRQRKNTLKKQKQTSSISNLKQSNLYNYQLQLINQQLTQKVRKLLKQYKQKQKQYNKQEKLSKSIQQLRTKLEKLLMESNVLRKSLDDIRLVSKKNSSVKVFDKKYKEQQCCCRKKKGITVIESKLTQMHPQYENQKKYIKKAIPLQKIKQNYSIQCNLEQFNSNIKLQNKKLYIESLTKICQNQQRIIQEYQNKLNHSSSVGKFIKTKLYTSRKTENTNLQSPNIQKIMKIKKKQVFQQIV